MAGDDDIFELTDTAIAPASGGEPIAALQTEVMSAVRTAITSVMAGQANGIDLTGIDLNFSQGEARPQVPALLAKPEQALAVIPRQPEQRSVGVSRLAIAGALTLAVGGGAVAAWMQYADHKPHNGAAPQLVARPTVAASAAALPAPAAKAPIVVLTPVVAVEQKPAIPVEEKKPVPAKVVTATPAAPLKPQVAVTTVKPQLPAPVPSAPDVAALARTMLESGQVRDARALLLSVPENTRADIALVMARSFDANYLSSLKSNDSKPDSGAARLWYQRWYELASKDGSVPTTVRLDRLLQSLP